MKKSRAKIILLTVAFFISFFCIQKVLAGDYGGLETTAGAANLKSITSVQSLIGNIIGAGLSLISVIFFALMLFAGIRWMTARGNEEAETKARDTIFAAAIGMVIIMASYGLTNLVFNAATRGGTMAGSADSDKKISSKSGSEIPKAGSWCLILETGECLQGGGSPCSGVLFNSQDECINDDVATVACLNQVTLECNKNVTSLSCKEGGSVAFADMEKCKVVADKSKKLVDAAKNPKGFCAINNAIKEICSKLDKTNCNESASNNYGCKWVGSSCVANSQKCDDDFRYEYGDCVASPVCGWVGDYEAAQTDSCTVNKAVQFGCSKLTPANCTKTSYCKQNGANCEANHTNAECGNFKYIDQCLGVPSCMI